MDGIPGVASLPQPPVPAGVPAPPGGGAFYQPQPPVQPQQQPQQRGAVGRPSADPERQEEREQRSRDKTRLRSLLPTAMTDGKIVIFRLGKKGIQKTSTRPVMTILFSELEKAGDTDRDAYLREKLEARFNKEGRFLCEPHDNRGQLLREFGAVEIDLSDAEPEEEEEEDEGQEEHFEPAQPQVAGRKEMYLPNGKLNPRYIPPPPDPNDIWRLEKQELRQDSAMQLMMATMQQQVEQRRLDEQRRRDDEERRMERERERDEARKEREEARRVEEERRREKDEERREVREREERQREADRQMQVIKLMTDKGDKPDLVMGMLMKMIESKGDRDGTKELFGMLSESSRQSMLSQGESSRQMLASQAEVSKMMISNVMGISKAMVESMMEAQSSGPDDTPMDKLDKVFKMLGPVLTGLANNGKNAAAIQQQAIAHAPTPGQPVSAPVQNAQPSRATHPQVPDQDWVKGALYTIMRLETGEFAPQQRIPGLAWCAQNLPPAIQQSIRGGDQNQIIALCMESGGVDDRIMGWFSDENAQAFLTDAVKDLQKMLIGAWDQSAAQASIEAHGGYHRAKAAAANGQPFPMQAEAAKSVEATVADAKPEKPRARPAPMPPGAVQMAEPVAAPKPAVPKVPDGLDAKQPSVATEGDKP